MTAWRGSRAELLTVLGQHPAIRESVNFSIYRLHDIVPSGIAGVTHYLGVHADRDKADYFVEHLGDGVGLGLNDPIRRLRELLIRDRRNKRNPLREVEKWALAVKAMNAFFQGAEVRLLVWRPGAGEGFPRVLEALHAPPQAFAAPVERAASTMNFFD